LNASAIVLHLAELTPPSLTASAPAHPSNSFVNIHL